MKEPASLSLWGCLRVKQARVFLSIGSAAALLLGLASLLGGRYPSSPYFKASELPEKDPKLKIARILSIVLISFSADSLFANSDSELAKDITAIVSGMPRERVELSSDQLWITSELCGSKNETIAKAAASFLADKKLKSAAQLAEKSIAFICAVKAARNDWEDAQVEPLKAFLSTDTGFNVTSYRGDKLGTWACETEDKLERSSFSAMGLFNGNETLSWKVEANGDVSLWLAPYKHQASDTVRFGWHFSSSGWQVSEICLSSRI